ncbi:unnamed protein product, partial [Allacma fusca]
MLTTPGKHEVERKRPRDDHIVLVPEPGEDKNISIISDLAPLKSRFENCKEFLRKAYVAHPPAPLKKAIPCSKSASNIHSFTLEDHNEVNTGGVRRNFKESLPAVEDSLDEVEIVSLLEEKVPKYKLRADCITRFG